MLRLASMLGTQLELESVLGDELTWVLVVPLNIMFCDL